MAMKKILERQVKRTKRELVDLVDRRLKEMKKEYAADYSRYAIDHHWSRPKGVLGISSSYGGGMIILDEGKIEVYADIPFVLRAFNSVFLKTISGEIEKLLKRTAAPAGA